MGTRNRRSTTDLFPYRWYFKHVLEFTLYLLETTKNNLSDFMILNYTDILSQQKLRKSPIEIFVIITINPKFYG